MIHPTHSAYTNTRPTFAFSLSLFSFLVLPRLGMVRHHAQKPFLFFFLLLLLLLLLLLRVGRSEGRHPSPGAWPFRRPVWWDNVTFRAG